jgi:hypothetical protein
MPFEATLSAGDAAVFDVVAFSSINIYLYEAGVGELFHDCFEVSERRLTGIARLRNFASARADCRTSAARTGNRVSLAGVESVLEGHWRVSVVARTGGVAVSPYCRRWDLNPHALSDNGF